MSKYQRIRKTITFLLIIFFAIIWGCTSKDTPGKPRFKPEIMTRWQSFLSDPAWMEVNAVRIDEIVTAQEKIQKHVSLLLNSLNELYSLYDGLKKDAITKRTSFDTILSRVLNNINEGAEKARTAYENYAFYMTQTDEGKLSVGQLLRDNYDKMMKGFPAENHPTANSIYKYFYNMKKIPKDMVSNLLYRTDFQENYVKDIVESIEERRRVFQGMEKMIKIITENIQTNSEVYFTQKNIPVLDELEKASGKVVSGFLQRAVKTIDKNEGIIAKAKEQVICYAKDFDEECFDGETKKFANVLSPVLILSSRGLIAPTLVIPENYSAISKIDIPWREERTQTLFTPNLEMIDGGYSNDNTHVGGGDLDVTDLDDAVGMPNEYPFIFNHKNVKGILIYEPVDDKWFFELDKEKIFIPNPENLPELAKQTVKDNGNKRWIQSLINFTITREDTNYQTGEGYTLELNDIIFITETVINLSLVKTEVTSTQFVFECDASIAYALTADTKIKTLALYVNNVLTKEDSEKPYIFNLNTAHYADGKYKIKVIAYDNTDNSVEKTDSIIIDNNSPYIKSAYPKGNSISYNNPVIVNFSESMDPATINNSTFVITQGGTQIPGAINFNKDYTQVVFIPNTSFGAGITYSVKVTEGVADQAGNHIEYNYGWSFKTSGYSNKYEEGLFNGSTYGN